MWEESSPLHQHSLTVGGGVWARVWGGSGGEQGWKRTNTETQETRLIRVKFTRKSFWNFLP